MSSLCAVKAVDDDYCGYFRFKGEERDMKDCGGCLGPVVGHHPDLGNLQYSISIVSRYCL